MQDFNSVLQVKYFYNSDKQVYLLSPAVQQRRACMLLSGPALRGAPLLVAGAFPFSSNQLIIHHSFQSHSIYLSENGDESTEAYVLWHSVSIACTSFSTTTEQSFIVSSPRFWANVSILPTIIHSAHYTIVTTSS